MAKDVRGSIRLMDAGALVSILIPRLLAHKMSFKLSLHMCVCVPPKLHSATK